MSTPFGQSDKFSEQMRGADVTQFQVMLDSGYFPAIRKAVMGGSKLPSQKDFAQFLKLGNLYPDLTELKGIVIPDGATIKTLKAAGGYGTQSDYAKQYLTDEHFKVTVHGPRNLFLARFKKNVTSKYVQIIAKDMGYGMALVEDLLCVGAPPEHRELQRQFLILALGSSTFVCGDRCVPCLRRWHDGQGLGLYRYGGEWHGDCRFLLVGPTSPEVTQGRQNQSLAV